MDELIPLRNSTLGDLPQGIRTPSFDRSGLSAGILHIGLGNFHRAHQSWYLSRLMDMGLHHDWAIVGAGVRAYDAAQREKLLAQDCLTTLVELDPSGTSAEVVGSMIDYVPIADGNGPLIDRMARPDIRIVSLTVTEGGYYLDPVSKELDTAHPDIVHDAENPDTPRTAFGAIVAALKLRRARGVGPFTGQSCDNLQGNGTILRQTVVNLAKLSDPDLAEWINSNCTFPNSMVDCIVPGTGDKELDLVRKMGVDDAVPVTHENFRQWVIEDDFCAGRPDWDKVGATFTDLVHDYETQKIRILNSGHQVVAAPAEVMGIHIVSEIMEHPLLDALLRKVVLDEIAPYVPAVPGMTPQAYYELIAERFANPAIVDTTRRLAFDGSSRHTGFLLPTIRDALAGGTSVSGLALAEAFWARMCAGTREDGTTIEPNDPLWHDISPVAQATKERPRAWLEQERLYGDLVEAKPFADAFEAWLSLIWSDGCEAALKKYLAA